MEHTCIKLNDTRENAMDSENGISRPTEGSIYLLVSQCLCLSFYVCEGEEEMAKTDQTQALKEVQKNLPYMCRFHFTW